MAIAINKIISHASFAGMAIRVGLNPLIAEYLQLAGYKSASDFAYALARAEYVEEFLEHMFIQDGLWGQMGGVGGWDRHPEAGKVRRLWNDCIHFCQSAVSPAAALAPPSAPIDQWAVQPPARLTPELTRTLKDVCKAKYLSESLEALAMPGERYFSSVYPDCLRGGTLKWYSWTYCLPVSQEGKLLEQQNSDRPRPGSDIAAALCFALFDLSPQLNEEKFSGTYYRLLQLFTVRANAYALTGKWHLVSRKTLHARVL